MNRRALLRAGATGFPALLRSRVLERPNILFLFVDDWGRYASAYRDPRRPSFNDVVRTPNIDRIANEGVRFTNAFMATPSCTPSRAAVATGCYSFRTGRNANLRGGDWTGVEDPGRKLHGFGERLEASGYLVRDSYKTLAAPWLGGKKLARRDFLRYSLHVSGATTAAEQARRKDEFTAQARDSIRGVLAQRQPGQPFLHMFGPINAHRPWAWQSGTKLWGIDPDSLRGKMPAFLPDIPLVRQDMADYLGEVQAVDLLAGAFLEELEKAGELERTMVVLSGDNGIGGMPRGKCNLYDFGTRAPLLIRWPGRAKPGLVVDDFVNLMDLAPTFLEAGGTEPLGHMNGRSLMKQIGAGRSGVIGSQRDFVITTRERHVPDARAGNLPYPSRAIRTAGHLYIRNFHPDRWPMGDPIGLDGGASLAEERLREDTMVTYKDHDASPTKAWLVTHRNDSEGRRFHDLAFARRPAEELYDLRTDPDQVRNVAGEKQYAATRDRLATRLMTELRAAGDPRLDDAFDRPPYVERL